MCNVHSSIIIENNIIMCNYVVTTYKSVGSSTPMVGCTNLWQDVCPLELALDQAMVVLSLVVFPFHHDTVLHCLHGDLFGPEVRHVHVHFEFLVVVAYLAIRTSGFVALQME